MNDSNPFQITGGTPEPRFLGAPVDETDRAAPALERVEKLITSANVFLFMKGVPEQPQCGFSANTVAILETIGIPYEHLRYPLRRVDPRRGQTVCGLAHLPSALGRR